MEDDQDPRMETPIWKLLVHRVSWQKLGTANALNQFSVQTEAELVTGEVWSLKEKNNRRKKQDTKEKVKYAYSELQQQFQSVFESMEPAGRCCEVSDQRKNMPYEMKASAWYQVTYHPVLVRRSQEMEPNGTTKLSFAWISQWIIWRRSR
jgi:RNA-dependent RNA polymerase